MSVEFPAGLQRYVAESIAASLRSFGLTTEPAAPKQHKFSETSLAAVIGVRGDGILGSLLVAAEGSFLEARHPMGEAARGQAALLADWIGEIANLTVGALNERLEKDGIIVKISPPSVEPGAGTVLRGYAQRKPSQRFWVDVGGGELVCCQLSVDLEPGAVIGGEK